MAITEGLVRQVNPFPTIDSARIVDFIADATEWLEALGVDVAPCHTALSYDLVVKYLACHYAALCERQLKASKIGPASEQYGGEYGKGLEFTQYGQKALLYDCSGILQEQGKKKVSVGFFGGADNRNET